MGVIVFDFDGVLADSLDAHNRFFSDTGIEFGLDIIREKIKKSLTHPTENFWEIIGVPEELVPEIHPKDEQGTGNPYADVRVHFFSRKQGYFQEEGLWVF